MSKSFKDPTHRIVLVHSFLCHRSTSPKERLLLQLGFWNKIAEPQLACSRCHWHAMWASQMLWLKTTVVMSSTFHFENIQNKVERVVQTPPHLALPIVNSLLHSLIYPRSVSSYRAPSFAEPFESYRCDTGPLNISTLYPKKRIFSVWPQYYTLVQEIQHWCNVI